MDLSRWGARVVAFSNDTPAQVETHQRRDHLKLELRSDAKLVAIKALGLLHQRGLPFKTFYLFGIPLGYPTPFKSMAIPTTVLLDEDGVVRWLDQATDYRQRSDSARVEAALNEAFGPPTDATS